MIVKFLLKTTVTMKRSLLLEMPVDKVKSLFLQEVLVEEQTSM
jgi:hypothetical protein